MQLRVYSGDKSHPIESPAPAAAIPEEHLLGQYIPLHYHYNMLQDESRVGAFREAIQLAVRPGMRVVELGGGTGILSSFAASQGAQVSCVERNPELVRKSRALIKANGLEDSIDVVEMDAFAYLPSEPIDIVICEMLHVALLREKQLSVIESFKRRYQRAFGDALPRFLPEASILMVQPVEHDFDYSGYWAPTPVFQAPSATIARTRELGPLTPYATISYDESYPVSFQWAGSFAAAEAGVVTAVRFVTQNAVAIDVDRQRAINWPNQCLVLPVKEPLQVAAGEPIEIGFSYEAGASIDGLAGSLVLASGTAAVDRRRVA